MQLLALLVIQTLAVILIVGNSPQSRASHATRQALKQVLGISYVAQDTTDQTQPTDQPTQSTDQPQPTDQIQQAQPTQETQPTTVQTTEQPTPQETITPEQPTETPAVSEVPTTETPTPEGQLNSQQTADLLTGNPETPVIENTIITADTSVASTSGISNDAATQSERNDALISSATTPDQQSTDILESEQEDLNLLNTTAKNNNFTTSSFLTQRFIDNLQNLTATLSATTNPISVQTRMTALCNQADTQLRTQQLVVPEEMEQDMEIARSLCR